MVRGEPPAAAGARRRDDECERERQHSRRRPCYRPGRRSSALRRPIMHTVHGAAPAEPTRKRVVSTASTGAGSGPERTSGRGGEGNGREGALFSPSYRVRRARPSSRLIPSVLSLRHPRGARSRNRNAPCRTSWLRITPVTPLAAHHRFVTSGPNAIPTPWMKSHKLAMHGLGRICPMRGRGCRCGWNPPVCSGLCPGVPGGPSTAAVRAARQSMLCLNPRPGNLTSPGYGSRSWTEFRV